ncbi:MAG: MarR family transcriptional regulator [Spirochaetes bacterium]|nr:MarR family transcriptional regulator [Spirochaetota bacterium]
MKRNNIEEVRKLLRVFERSINNNLKEETSCCGVTLPQCHVLMELYEKNGLSVIELSDILGLDKSTLSRTVDSLVKEEMVSREINPDDRRFMQIKMTEKGKAKTDFINNSANKFYQSIIDKVPEDHLPIFIRCLKIFTKALQDESSFSACCEKNK